MSHQLSKTFNLKNNKHKVEAVVIDKYYENTKKLIDDIDIVYLASKIPEDEKNQYLSISN